MTFLRRLFTRSTPPEPANLDRHDQLIQALERSACELQRLNDEPITARVRGNYACRVLPARNPHRTEKETP